MIEWIKRNPFVVIVLLILVAIIVYLLVKYIATSNQLEREQREHGTYVEVLKEKYERETRILEETADELRQQMESAPSTVEATVVPIHHYHTVRIPGSSGSATPPVLPTSCNDCLSKVVIPYRYSNEYFTLQDLLKWNPDTQGLESDENDRKLEYSGKFKEALVAIGLQKTEEEDEKFLRARLQFIVDNGIQDDVENPVIGMGVGVGAEVLNFISLTNISLGANVAGMIVPEAIWRSHVLAGIDWRFFRNVSLGLAYGRSLTHNQVLLNLAVFPMD